MGKYVVRKALGDTKETAQQVTVGSYEEAVKIANGMLKMACKEYGHPWGEATHKYENDECTWDIHSELQPINPDKHQTEGTFSYTYTDIEGLEDELERYDAAYIIQNYSATEIVTVSIKEPKQAGTV